MSRLKLYLILSHIASLVTGFVIAIAFIDKEISTSNSDFLKVQIAKLEKKLSKAEKDIKIYQSIDLKLFSAEKEVQREIQRQEAKAEKHSKETKNIEEELKRLEERGSL